MPGWFHLLSGTIVAISGVLSAVFVTQRALIARAIQPVWEADHIWLILIVVLINSDPFSQSASSTYGPIAIHNLKVPYLANVTGRVIRTAQGVANDLANNH